MAPTPSARSPARSPSARSSCGRWPWPIRRIAAFAIAFTIARIPAARRSLAAVETALGRARSRRDAASRRDLRAAADKASRRVSELDPDHTVIEQLVAELVEARSRPEIAQKGELGRTAATQAFARRVEAMERASAAVTDARNRLAQANIGLVFHVAGKYLHRGLTLPDLVQEGMLGLIKAIDRFDYRRGFRFSTYATWWIRHHIGRALSDKSRLIRVPVHVQESYQRINAVGAPARRASWAATRPRPSWPAASGIDVDTIEQVREAVRSNPVSLDERLGDDEDRTRHDLLAIPDTEAASAFESVHRQSMARAARHQMEKHLSRVEIDVLHKRFALDGADREWTLQEVADTYGLSRERIRQIQDRALQKLRAGPRGRPHRPRGRVVARPRQASARRQALIVAVGRSTRRRRLPLQSPPALSQVDEPSPSLQRQVPSAQQVAPSMQGKVPPSPGRSSRSQQAVSGACVPAVVAAVPAVPAIVAARGEQPRQAQDHHHGSSRAAHGASIDQRPAAGRVHGAGEQQRVCCPVGTASPTRSARPWHAVGWVASPTS